MFAQADDTTAACGNPEVQSRGIRATNIDEGVYTSTKVRRRSLRRLSHNRGVTATTCNHVGTRETH